MLDPAENPATSSARLAKLARSDDLLTRFMVAGNPATPAEVLAILARDPGWQVRCLVACHPLTRHETLAELLGDSNEVVGAVAGRQMRGVEDAEGEAEHGPA